MERLVPAAGWLRGYRRSWLLSDLIAGTTAAAVVIPQAMGYATVAGLPAQIGLYTCIVPMVAYAALGGSRRLSFSTTSTIVVLVALALDAAGASSQDAVGAGATLTLLVGVALFGFATTWASAGASTAGGRTPSTAPNGAGPDVTGRGSGVPGWWTPMGTSRATGSATRSGRLLARGPG